MTAARRALIAVGVVRGTIRRWQPRTYWQVWIAAGSLPLAALVIGVCLQPVFHTWPQLDATGAAYIALVGTRQSLALRARRRAREQVDAQRHMAEATHR